MYVAVRGGNVTIKFRVGFPLVFAGVIIPSGKGDGESRRQKGRKQGNYLYCRPLVRVEKEDDRLYHRLWNCFSGDFQNAT